MIRRMIDSFSTHRDQILEVIAVIGVLSTLLAVFLPQDVSDYIKYGLIFLFIVMCCTVFIMSKPGHLDIDLEKSVYFMNIPCNSTDLNGAIGLASRFFGLDTIDPSVVRHAYKSNPLGFVVLRNSKNQVVGYTDFYLIKSSSFDKFVSGDISEKEFLTSDFCDVAGIHNCKVYVGGIVASSSSKYERAVIAKCLVYGVCRTLLKYYMNERSYLDIHAYAYSKSGEMLLENLDFVKLDTEHKRTGDHSLFSRRITKRIIRSYCRDNGVGENRLIINIKRI